MADALVSIVLERLASVLEQQIHQQVTLVVGVESEVDNLNRNLQTIRAVLANAEKRQFSEEVVKLWIERLEDISYQMDDVVDGWNTALLKLQIAAENPGIPKPKISSCLPSPFVCFKQVSLRHDIALQIKDINKQLHAIANERHQFKFVSSSTIQQPQSRITSTIQQPQSRNTSSVIDVSQFCGRDADIDVIIDKLLGGSSQEGSSLYIISIVGMGGIGKTTLAQLAINDDRVKAYFHERMWVCVSDPFDPMRISRAILEALRKESSGFENLEALQQIIRTLIADKKFLLVLDDVWTENYILWEQVESSLKGGAPGSRILVTTRNENVSTMMGTAYKHPLGELSKELCWSLFSNIAFKGRRREEVEELENIGRKIADKCRGLPLAAKVLGGLMRLKGDKEEDWESILNNEIWQLDVIEERLSPYLLLSYYDLSPAVKRCFSYCAVFPKDQIIEKDRLIKLWMANGYLNSRESMEMEKTGRDYFEDLVSRSLFQDFDRDDEGNIISCKMHDIVHDLAQYLTKNECFILEIDEENKVRMASSFQKARHATLIGKPGAQFPSTFHNLKYLHTLLAAWVVDFNTTAQLPPNLFKHLVCLRALDLSGNHFVGELPRNLGKLIHLRFLDLSYHSFDGEFPETICDLYNLQTLILSNLIVKLPRGMRKLINLRHLEWDSSSQVLELPKGIGRLTSLRTLPAFPITFRRDACKIGELKNLNSLRGGLVINGIGDFEDAEEAGKAELKNKKHLHHLELSSFGGLASAASKGVVEALQPHQNLKSLKISYYFAATEFPSWIAASSLPQLKKLEIVSCTQVTCLPPLGELPLLEILIIEGMDRLKYVGGEFLGSLPTAFPVLKHLSFKQMFEWEKWEVKGEEEERRSVMPYLHSLTTYNCRKLESLPERLLQITTLQKLSIHLSPATEFPGWIAASSLAQLKKLEIVRCAQVTCLPPLGELPLLESLRIEDMDRLKYVGGEFLGSSTTAFPRLKLLRFNDMEEWEKWEVKEEDDEEEGRSVMPHLHSLTTYKCPKLESLPERLLQITSLQELNIIGSPTLQDRYHEETGEDWSKISHIQRVLAGNEEFDCEFRRFSDESM
ncbi:disease resistance protein RGA2-like isoform X1 [Vitis riparia]|uniref:disease resistance protein RGA2-like isoform X1 n=1 Tax=Vitis riparia TaxID=96939 RepID=UPI00155AEAD8|nr:disease resistance protein RGA2-like isoform X1 [Vitis riparia]